MSTNKNNKPTVNFFHPAQFGFLSLFGQPMPRVTLNGGVIGRFIGFLIVWGSIGFGIAGVGYVSIHYVLPTVSISMYEIIVRETAPYYQVFAWFAKSTYFFPASVSSIVTMYFLIENSPAQIQHSTNTPVYRVREEAVKITIYTVLILGLGWAYFVGGYGNIALSIGMVVSGWILATRLKKISQTDRYSAVRDNTFYPRKIPVAVIYGVYVFSILSMISGMGKIGAISVSVSVVMFYLLLGFRCVYSRLFDTNPELFYAYSETDVSRQSKSNDTTNWDSELHHAIFVEKLFNTFSLQVIGNKDTQSNDSYNPIGETDRALNRSATPTKNTNTKPRTQNSPNEKLVKDSHVNSNPTKSNNSSNTYQDDALKDDGGNTILNSHIDNRSGDDRKVFVPEPNRKANDFEKPVLHYTSEIETDLVFDIDTNPLVPALEMLNEIEEIDSNEKFNDEIRKLKRKTKQGWWTLEETIQIRDAISPSTPNNDAEKKTYKNYDVLYQYSKQLTKVERYLRREKGESTTPTEN